MTNLINRFYSLTETKIKIYKIVRDRRRAAWPALLPTFLHATCTSIFYYFRSAKIRGFVIASRLIMSDEIVALLKDLKTNDLYEFFSVTPVSSDKDITRAYKKKALQHHPDKNPDDPRASETFQKIAKAYEILSDPAAKAAYDKWVRAKQASLRRAQELSGKRKKLKEELELQEQLSAQETEYMREANRSMEAEIARLRTEGREWIKKQEELLRAEFQSTEEDPTLKVQWKAAKTDTNNGGYSRDILMEQFGKYGKVLDIIVSKKKNGRALVVFEKTTCASQAFLVEKGLATNPLTLSWAAGKPVIEETSTIDSKVDLESYELATFARLREAQKSLNQQSVTNK